MKEKFYFPARAALVFVLLLVFSACASAAESPDVSEGVSADLEVTFFSVGKGDCILLRSAGFSMMIDTGYRETEPAVAGELRGMAAASLDCLLLTHYDRDHAGGAADIIREFRPSVIYAPDYEQNNNSYRRFMKVARETGSLIKYVSADISFDMGGAGVTLYGLHNYDGMVPNEHSVICDVTYGERKFLFTGDALERRLRDFNDTVPPCRYDLIKLPHHGMFLMNSKAFRHLLSVSRPEFCVYTDNSVYWEGNSFKLFLELSRVKDFHTKYGEIKAVTDGKSLQIYQNGTLAAESSEYEPHKQGK